MISVRSLLIGIVVGAIVSVLVHKIVEQGLNAGAWDLTSPRTGQAIVSGALIGAISQMFGQTRGRR